MGHSKFKSSNEVKVFWGKSQPEEQLASKRQAAQMSHERQGRHTSGRDVTPAAGPCSPLPAGKVATGVPVPFKFNIPK